MGFPLTLALRYMRSRKRAFISVSTVFAIIGVALGTAALATVMSVTGGFRAEFRDKVLGVNAHVLVLKYSSEFRDYREVMAKVQKLPEVTGVGPFVINPMMVTHAGRTATGVLLKGVDPELMGTVLDLPRHMIAGSLDGLAVPGRARPEPRPALQPGELRAPLPGQDDEEPAVPSPAGDPDSPTLELTPPPRPEGQSSFLDLLRALPDAGKASAPAAGAGELVEEPLQLAAGDLPVGSIVPQGGYSSELPEDDVLSEGIDPDP